MKRRDAVNYRANALRRRILSLFNKEETKERLEVPPVFNIVKKGWRFVDMALNNEMQDVTCLIYDLL
jgi:hypothetical protein